MTWLQPAGMDVTGSAIGIGGIFMSKFGLITTGRTLLTRRSCCFCSTPPAGAATQRAPTASPPLPGLHQTGTAHHPWWSFGESAPSFLELTLCVVLPSILLALLASLGRWCLAWWKTIPTVSLPGIDRASRFFRPVDAGVIPNQAAPTFRCSASHLILPTASFPIQETLVNAVGLTSVARRLQ